MISHSLKKAREYEETAGQKIKKEERPALHLTARTGWMNDPNGFSWYGDRYHLFYQYHPYDTYWGPMHWGHAVSGDLILWTYLPAALAPDTPCDSGGCFSGSAVKTDDGKHLLMYTGVEKVTWEDGSDREIQTQCIAVGDGSDYEKYPGNPVLTRRNLPQGASPFDFRDPRVWRDKDGTYRCVAGSCDGAEDGRILRFSSPDGFHWQEDGVLAENGGRFGKMWECPDFFSLDGKDVLLVSPQNMLPKGLEYRNGSGTLCLMGRVDRATGRLQEESDQALDYGIDFYAPQTVKTPDGRRVMIGWMQNWDTCRLRWEDRPWFGQMSIPRELSVRNGRLCQQPVRELERYRRNKKTYSHEAVRGRLFLEGIEGRVIDLEICLRPADRGHMYRSFQVRFAENGNFWTSVTYRPCESVAELDRSFSGIPVDMVNQRRCRVSGPEGEVRLRIILDRFSAEIFVNGGEQVMTAVISTGQDAKGISFAADGEAVMDVVKYDLVT